MPTNVLLSWIRKINTSNLGWPYCAMVKVRVYNINLLHLPHKTSIHRLTKLLESVVLPAHSGARKRLSLPRLYGHIQLQRFLRSLLSNQARVPTGRMSLFPSLHSGI